MCADAFVRSETVIVPYVEDYPGHIACDGETESEIVLPLKDANGHTVGVLDLDSVKKGTFDEEDRAGLEPIARLLGKWCGF